MSHTARTTAKTALAVLVVVLAAAGLLLHADVPQVPSNFWAPAGDMTSVRAGASGTLLPNGLVLVAGGIDANGATASVERFSPDGAHFIEAPAMQLPRANHTATLLADGRVLVAGGIGAGGAADASAEIYDSAANVWQSAGSLNVARRGHTATRLPDGKVLIAGGDDNGVAIDPLEVFDPETGLFTVVDGASSGARTLHAAAALLDGRVLIAGGFDGTNPLASTSTYDPETNTVSAGPDLSTPRSGLSATTLLDGRVLVAGGAGANGELASAEIFDPVTNAFTSTDNTLSSARQNHLAFLLPHNNQVLFLGGLADYSPVAAAEYFTPWEGTNGVFCAQAICASGYQGPAAPATARAWATGSALSYPADTTYRTGPNDGMLVLAGGNGQQSAELFGFATVNTDKDDYAPGTTVRITGSGWKPGEWVAILLKESPIVEQHWLADVEVDEHGNFETLEFAPDANDLGVRFYLTVYGEESQAQTTFTDASQTNTTITSSLNPSTVGVAVTFQATVRDGNTPGIGTPITVGTVKFGTGNNCTGGFTPFPGASSGLTLNASGQASFVHTFTTTTGSPFTVRACYSGTGGGTGTQDSDGTLQQTVNAAKTPLTVTASNHAVTYGAVVPTVTPSYSGFTGGDTPAVLDSPPTCTTTYTSGSPVSGSPYPTSCSGGVDDKYSFTYVGGTVTVSTAALTITASNKTKTYGQTVTFDETTPSTDFSVVGLINSDTVTSITLTSAGAVATALVSGSPYAIVPSAAVGTGLDNYTIGYVNGSLTVDPAALTITASDRTKTYGQTVTFDDTTASTDFSVVGLVNSDTVTSITLTSAGAAATALVSGSPYAIVPSAAVGTGLDNYTIGYGNGSLTVDPAALTITASDRTKTYGQTVTFDDTTASTDFSVVGLVNSDTVTSITLTSAGAAATALVSGSPYAIVPSAAVGTGLDNYTIGYGNGSLTVDPAALTITASDRTKTYGQTVTFDDTTASTDFSVVGLVNSDTVTSITLTSAGAAATALVSGSPYAIVPSAAVGTGLDNYTIGYGNGSLTVDPAALTITASDRTKTYGQTMTFDDTTASTDFSVVGLVNSDTVTSITLTSAGAAATALVSGSPYAIVPSAAVGTGLDNYTIGYGNGSLTVDPAALTITANNRSKVLGEVVTFDETSPSTDFTVTGLLNTDTVTSITLTSAGAPATATVAGSPYPIIPSAAVGTGLDNYTIGYVNGSLTVTYGVCAQYDQSASHKKGSTIPIKVTLCDASGVNVSSAAVILHATNITRVDASASPFAAEDSGNANPDSDFRYAGGFYIFNLSTKSGGFAQGTWQINFLVNGVSDPSYALKFDIK